VAQPDAAAGRQVGATTKRAPRRPAAISPRRQLLAWILAVVFPLLASLVLAQMHTALTLPSDLLVFLLVVVIVAALGGMGPAFVSALLGFLLANYYFTPPLHEFTVAEGENVLALVIFMVVGGVVSYLVSTASRRTVEAAQSRAEAETLAALSGTLAAAEEPLPQLVAQVREAFEADAVAVMSGGPIAWTVLASSGEPVPARPEDGELVVGLHGDALLVLNGAAVAHADPEILRAFVGQVATALERRELRAASERAAGLEEANELRTALLAAVSHDLRTPLSSIKAAVSSLLQRDVDFSPAATRELLETIDEGADRLNHLIGNLLDMSRLQTGALQLVMRDVGLDEVVPAALVGLDDTRLAVDVPETLPRVRADVALLERVVANVVENALSWSPSDAAVRIEACATQSTVELSVVDRGPGIPREQRDDVFLPFQRLGDRSTDTGVGLGLAVARGFVEAMDGAIEVDDTPGGGTTMVISLRIASP
jgi:two-component system sensor histidine kinase KdpD